MPRNGSGIFQKPVGTTAVSGQLVESAKYNELMDDFVADLNTPRPVAVGGTGVSTPEAFQAAFGLEIGVDVQAQNARLQSITTLINHGASRGLFTIDENSYATFSLTELGRTFLGNTTTAGQRAALGLGDLATVNILDEDGFGSNSATRPPSQQSTRQYITNYVQANVIGLGQAWANVVGSRALGVAYQNATDSPIQVLVRINGESTLEVSSNAVDWNLIATNRDDDQHSFIMPPGSYYRLTGNSVIYWSELR